MARVYVQVQTRLVIDLDANVSIDEIIQEMDYNFTSKTNGATIADTDIQDFWIND